jgi:hypothetical protein
MTFMTKIELNSLFQTSSLRTEVVVVSSDFVFSRCRETDSKVLPVPATEDTPAASDQIPCICICILLPSPPAQDLEQDPFFNERSAGETTTDCDSQRMRQPMWWAEVIERNPAGWLVSLLAARARSPTAVQAQGVGVQYFLRHGFSQTAATDRQWCLFFCTWTKPSLPNRNSEPACLRVSHLFVPCRAPCVRPSQPCPTVVASGVSLSKLVDAWNFARFRRQWSCYVTIPLEGFLVMAFLCGGPSRWCSFCQIKRGMSYNIIVRRNVLQINCVNKKLNKTFSRKNFKVG